MIIKSGYEIDSLTKSIEDIKNDKEGYRVQWKIIADLKERVVKTEVERAYTKQRLDVLEGNH